MSNDRLVPMGFTDQQFPACYLFNDDREQREMTARFINSGLASGEKVAYLVDHVEPEAFRAELTELGVTLPARDDPRFVLRTADEVCLVGGYFSPDRMLNSMEGIYGAGLAEGRAAARAGGEMTWTLRGAPGCERLVEYEARLNLLLREHPLTTVCQYDARRFDGATLYDVLSMPPLMIGRGQIVHNPYYVPPEEFLARRQGEGGTK